MMEAKRKVSKVIITEEGLFHDGQVPPDYTGPQLPIEVAHSILFVDERGNFTTFTLYAPTAMDNTRHAKAYSPSEMLTIEAPVAETYGDENEYKHRMPQEVVNKLMGHTNIIENDGESKVLP